MKNCSKCDKGKLICIIVTLCIIGLFIIGVFHLDKNYNKFNGYDVDFSDGKSVVNKCDVNNKDGIALDGKWEFYYNKWLITDNITDATPDGYLSPKQQYDRIKIDGKRLKNRGYATYRIVVENLPNNVEVYPYNEHTPVPWYGYVNGKLVTKYGTISKNREENVINGSAEFVAEPEKSEDGKYEIIIELSDNKYGGMEIGYLLKLNQYDRESFGIKLGKLFLFLLVLALTIVFLGISIVLGVITKQNKLFFTFSIMLVLLLAVLMISADFVDNLVDFTDVVSGTHLRSISYGVAIFVMLYFLYHLIITNAIKINKKVFFIWFAINVVCVVASICLVGYTYHFYLVMLNLLLYLYVLYLLIQNLGKDGCLNIGYLILGISLIISYTYQILSEDNMIIYGPYNVTEIAVAVMSITIAVMYFIFIGRDYTRMYEALEKQRNIEKLKAQVLRAQIRPHFIFNTLAMVKDSYHRSMKKGDWALNTMAKYMRSNVEADTKIMVQFEEELSALDNYFELENIRHDYNINLYYDIDETDFTIPMFTLQPFVENAIKYSRIYEINGGYIKIKSYKDKEDNHIIEIIDNGVGFDTSKIKKNSTGINNTKERLEILLGATVEIQSQKGKGTKVKIKIPTKKGGYDANSSS